MNALATPVRPFKTLRTATALAGSIAALLLAHSAQAAAETWIGGTGNWIDGTWSPDGIAPGATSGITNQDIATFNGSSTGVVTVDSYRNLLGIDDSGGLWTLQGGTLYMSNGGTIDTSGSGTNSGAFLVTSSLVLEGNSGTYSFTAGSTDTSLSLQFTTGTISGVSTLGNTTVLTLNGTNTSTGNLISDVISNGTGGGALAIVKNDAGTWTLSGANTFTGGTTLNAGTLLVGNASALGTGTLTLNGGSFGHTAALTISNNILVTGTTTIGSLSASQTANLTLSGALAGNGTLQNFVGGTGNQNVYFTGNFSGFTGTINYTDSNANTTAFWRVGATGATSDLSRASVILNNGTGGTTKLFGFTDGINGATMRIGALSGDGVFQGAYNGGANNVVQVGALNTNTTFAGVLGVNASNMANFGLTKAGNGTLILSGANLYTATTNVSNGTLQVGNGTSGSLTTGALTFSGTGRFNYQGANAGSSQTMGALTFSTGTGNATIQTTYGTSGTTALTFASLGARAAGQAANFVVSGGTNGSSNKIVFTTAPTAGALIDKGFYFNGADFAAYDAAGYMRALAYGTDTNSAAVDTIATANNIKLSVTPAAQNSISLLTLNLAGDGVSWVENAGQLLTLSSGGLIKSGGGGPATISGGSGLTTGSATELVVRTDTASDSLEIAVPILNTLTAGVTKSGLGTLILSGTGNAYTGTTTVDSGTLTLTGTATGGGDWTIRNSGILNLNGAVTNGGIINLAPGIGGVATVNMSAAYSIPNGKTITVGSTAGGVGVLNIGAGTNISGGNSPIDAGTVGHGVINVTGGSITPGQFLVAGIGTAGATGVWNITGGTIQTVGNNGGTIGATAGTTGVVNISGGTYTSTGTTANGVSGIFVGEAGIGSLNVFGAGLMNLGGVSTSAGLDIGRNNVTTSAGVVNLGAVGAGGGTIVTNIVRHSGAAASGIFNFHGGTLRAATNIANTTFMNGLTGAYVYGEGGTIDNNSQNITIGQALLAPTGLGVGSITLSGTTTGFTPGATPLVTISGGGGTGATAIANVDASGNLSIVVTNPGTGYTSTPIVSLFGNTGVGATTAIASLATNTSGGLTFTGSGTTTLTGVSTYKGQTTVSAGTLKLTSGASLASSTVALAGGVSSSTMGTLNVVDGTLSTTSLGGLVLGDVSAGLPAQLNMDYGPSSSDTLALGIGGLTINAGGANITLTNIGGAPSAGLTFNLITFAAGSGNGFTLGTGSTVGSLTLTNGNFGFGVLGLLNVTSTAVQIVTIGNTAPTTAYWSGALGSTWTANDGTDGNFTTDKAGTNFVAAYPSTSTDVIYASSSASTLSTTLGQDFSIKSLTFDGTTAAANISGANTLTIGTGGITVQGGNGGATLGMTALALGASQTWTNASNIDLNVSAAVTGLASNTLTINNTSTGATVLSGASTYSGQTNVISGILRAGSATGFSPNSTINLANTAGVTLDTTGFNSTVGSLAGGGALGGNVTLGAATLTTGANNANTTYAGVISGTGGLTKSGTGTQTLTGTNAYTGVTTISAGVLQIGDGTTDGSIATTSGIVDNATLTFNRVGSFVDSTVISGTGGVTMTGPGTESLNGNNTYTGTTMINSGTLTLSGGVLGSTGANIQISPNSTDTGTLNVTGGTLTAQRVIIGGDSNNDGTPGAGTVLLSGGTINSRQWFTVGSGNGAATTNASGVFTMTGGTLNVNAASGTNMEVANFAGTTATVTMSGSSSAINILNNGSINIGANNGAGNGTFTQNGGTVSFYSDAGTTIGGTGALRLGTAGTLASTSTYTYNLNGGTLIVPQIARNTATTDLSTGIFNFNGGTLIPAAASTAFLAVSTANVRNGGALINTNGLSVTIAQALVHSNIVGDNATDGGLTKSGNGVLTLTGASTYTGGTTVNGGSLTLSRGTSDGIGTIRGALTINNGATVNATTVNAMGFTDGLGVSTVNINGGTLNTSATGDQGFSLTYNLTGGTLTSNGGVSSAAATSYWVLGKSAAGSDSINTFASSTTSTIAGRINLRSDNSQSTVAFNVADGAAATDLQVSAAITSSPAAVGITKSGAGAMELSGASTYTGATIVTGGSVLVSGSLIGTTAVNISNGATVKIGAANNITSTATLNLTNGTFATGGLSETLGALSLGDGPSTIDFGSGASIFTLADSSAQTWTGTLSITNWSGNPLVGGGTDQLFFGNTASTLTAAQIAAIQFVNPDGMSPGSYSAQLLADGELVVAVPEPSAAAALIAGMSCLLGLQRFRRRSA